MALKRELSRELKRTPDEADRITLIRQAFQDKVLDLEQGIASRNKTIDSLLDSREDNGRVEIIWDYPKI